MSSIAKLRRGREEATNLLAKKLSETEQSNNVDSNLWKPYLDEEKGVGQATIRFLPAPDGEELPIIKIFDHGFRGANGKYYIEKSLSTIGKKDPVFDLNNRLWNSGGIPDEKGRTPDQKIASEQKRRTNYYSNILVISDPGRPQNEGKVFEYRFGPVIYEMIEQMLSPKFEGVARCNPFDLWEGATLQLRIRRDGPKKGGFWKYDQSKWDAPSEIFPGNDAAKEALWSQCKSLAARLAPESFKTYETLQARLLEVLGPYVGSGVPTVVTDGGSETKAAPAAIEHAPRQNAVPVSAPVQQKSVEAPKAASVAAGDEDLAFFETLARQAG